MNHMVNTCPLIKSEGGLNLLYEADDDAVDCETVGIPPLMSRKTLGILDGGKGGGVDRSWRRRGIKGVDKGGA